jgi:hypothetical protein
MMKLETDTPLSDVIKYIKDATQNEAAGLPSGIPIYVDPIGLQDADKSIADSVTPSRSPHLIRSGSNNVGGSGGCWVRNMRRSCSRR